MIVDEPHSHFIFIYHPGVYYGEKYTRHEGKELTNAQVLEYWGKWLVLGEKPFLDELARKLNPYVESRDIPCVKYDRKPSVNLDMDECVMMVYCDARQRDQVWDILSGFGVRLKAWVTEKETMDLWRPGAPLLERFLESQGFTEDQKQAIRDDAEKRINQIVNNPDEEFSPWAQ